MASLQTKLEICSRPYEKIAIQLGISEQEVINRIAKMKTTTIIRRISGFFNPTKLGYKSSLCATAVTDLESFSKVVATINSFPQVTHNYQRNCNQFNIWFTIIAHGDDQLQKVIQQIEQKAKCKIHNFPQTALYKLRVNFELGGSTLYGKC